MLSLTVLRLKQTAPSKPLPAPRRSVMIQWRDAAGNQFREHTHLKMDRKRGLTAILSQHPEPGTPAQVREASSSYPVEIVSVRRLSEGFEVYMDYVWEGRRRQHRMSVGGPATLECDGHAAFDVEVLNVSSGGMQVYSTQEFTEGAAARINGSGSDFLCLIRYCMPTSEGFHIGLQFYSELQAEKTDV
jgi:hypothetical protein